VTGQRSLTNIWSALSSARLCSWTSPWFVPPTRCSSRSPFGD